MSQFVAYWMPRVEALLDWLGTARSFTTLDLTKGYWQISLSPGSKGKTAFSTPYGLYQFVTLPFGLFGAPATIQCLMDRMLHPHAAYAAAYLDDVIIHSGGWAEHSSRWPRCSSHCGGRGSQPNQRSVLSDEGRYSIWGTTWVADSCVSR